MKRTILLLTLISLAPSTGCWRHSYRNPDVEPQAQPALKQWHHGMIFGLVDLTGPVDVQEVCGEGREVAEIKSKNSFLNLLVQSLTFSIYSPTKDQVYCAQRGP
ncbi:MAG TPA: Bor family protein [Myxococcales bacterium LLY-WYZ-16_1]|nr:Bor family protein [Myxococcales bacterium LLY-WYZ-16_1]